MNFILRSVTITFALVFATLISMPTISIERAHAAAAERDKLLEGAKKEGRLTLYTGMETEEASIFTKEFTKKYPFIKVDVFRSAGEKVQARFVVEHRANTHLADVFQTSIVQVYQLKNLGLLARYISEEAPAYAEGFKDPQGYWNTFYQLSLIHI